MTVDISSWGEDLWAYYTTGWEDALKKLRDQIEQALDDAGMAHAVTGQTGVNPSAPNPDDLYDSANSDWWDKWLNDRDAYAGDSNVLVMQDKGGATFPSGRNPDTTTDGCLTLVGGMDLDYSESVQMSGSADNEHYHDVYNELHELSHALDAPTGDKSIGRYYFNDFGNTYDRSPAHTMYDTTNECGQDNDPDFGVDTWLLSYVNCAQDYLTDQSA